MLLSRQLAEYNAVEQSTAFTLTYLLNAACFQTGLNHGEFFKGFDSLTKKRQFRERWFRENPPAKFEQSRKHTEMCDVPSEEVHSVRPKFRLNAV